MSNEYLREQATWWRDVRIAWTSQVVNDDYYSDCQDAWVNDLCPPDRVLHLIDENEQLRRQIVEMQTPGTARNTDPETSKWAGTLTRNSQRWKVLQAFFPHGEPIPPGRPVNPVLLPTLTSEEAADRAGLSPRSSPWKRVSELAQRGLIEATGETRLSSSKAPQTVYRMTKEGISAYHASSRKGRTKC